MIEYVNNCIDDRVVDDFLENFTKFPDLLGQFQSYLSVLYDAIAKSEEHSNKAISICEETFMKWNNADSNVPKEVVKCCLDMWLTVKGEDCKVRDFENVVNNLIIEEANVNDYVSLNNDRITFEPQTSNVIDDPMGNLLVEEVEVNDYVSSVHD